MAASSSRYARAFAQVVASSRLDASAAQQQLDDFAATLESSRPLREILLNPSIAQEQKVRILDAVAGRIGMLPQVRNFLAVITEHQRLENLREIIADYAVLADAGSGMVEAEIVSAHALDAASRSELEAQVVKLAGSKLRTTYREDGSLLGGVVVRIGSTVYDGSIKAQLAEMKQRLSGAQVA